ncbi:hypothetical protein [Mycoplasmopsis columboralis]|uniref:Lipoprotein n=1 Tax=Mycoplasmopsis columboralis TaxID=171282 RepID=A0A449B6F8_9BACT|nr:hypothetical protein [Mycoplasmopsis columboralis]VEU76184.1 Uncharacterised protein [Mycoplasmopsis columboralis]
MRLKNKLILGASTTSLIPLAAMSCSNERTAEENKAIVNAVASLVQVSVFDKNSEDKNERVKTNISDVYSSYVKSVRDVKFHGFNPDKYQVVNAEFENYNGYTVVKYQLQDIKTKTTSDQKSYTIRGFKLNPNYFISLTALQEANAELFKSEMRAEANTDVAARVKEFKDLESYVPNVEGYTADQFNKDLKTLEDYLKFLQNRFEVEGYSTDFEVESLGQYLEHEVDDFETMYPEYKEALHRLLSLKASEYLNNTNKNGLSDKDFDTYVQDFRDKAQSIKENPYWVRKPELREKYSADLEAVLDELDTLQSKDEKFKDKLQAVLEQYSELDLPLEDKIKYVTLKLLNSENGGNKLLNDIEAELNALRDADQQIPATDEEKAASDRYKSWIRIAQLELKYVTRKLGSTDAQSEFAYAGITENTNEVTAEEGKQKELEFYKSFRDTITETENSWYSQEQFDKDLAKLDEFLTFLQAQNVTDKDTPATKHWVFDVNNKYDVYKYNVDKFMELEPEYNEAIDRLNSLVANKYIKDHADQYELQTLKTKANELVAKFEEITKKPEFRGLESAVIRSFGDYDKEKFAKKLWEEEFESLGLNQLGSSENARRIILGLVEDPTTQVVQDRHAAFLSAYRVNPKYVTKAREFMLKDYLDQLDSVIKHAKAEYEKMANADITEEHKATAKDMQRWMRIAQVSLPVWRGVTGDQIDYASVNQKEADYWKSYDLSKYPLYSSNPELFNSDLAYYIKFLEFLQSENVNKNDETNMFVMNSKANKFTAESLTKEKHYYEANVDLYKMRLPKFREVFGRLKGLAAYNWLATGTNSDLVTPEAIQRLYEETKEKAQNIFFVDMTNPDATESANKPTAEPGATNYTANFPIVKKLFQEYMTLAGETSEAKTKLIDDRNYTFADSDLALRDRYFEYFLLTSVNQALQALERAYALTPVTEDQHNQIEDLKDYLKDFKPEDKAKYLEDLRNKVYTMLTRPDSFPGGPEGDKAKYSVDKFLGENYNTENASEYKGDLRDVANFLDYLDQSQVGSLQTVLPKNAKNEDKQEYSTKQYSDNELATYVELEKKFREAMTRITSYVAESFLEKETTDPRFKDTEDKLKELIEKYVGYYTTDKTSNEEALKSPSFAEEIAELDKMSALLTEIKETGYDFSKLIKDYFIGLPSDSVSDKNYIRMEELSKFILKLRAFEAHLEEYKNGQLTDAEKADLTTKKTELSDNEYAGQDLDKLSKDLLEVNKEFLHDDHEADPANHIKKHSYSESNLVDDVKLIVNFYKEADRLQALIKAAEDQNSSRLYRKALEQYNGAYSLAKAAYQGALERIYNNKLDLYKLKAKELNELAETAKFDTDVQSNNRDARTAYATARATQKSLLTLFALDIKNADDANVTEEQKVATAKTVLNGSAKEGETPAAKLANITNAINKELRLFILNVKQTKDALDENTNSSTTTSTN